MTDIRKFKSTVTKATVLYWHYTAQNFGSSTGVDLLGTKETRSVFQVEKGRIQEEITDITINKSINQAAGTFTISVLASQNWKAVLSPGDWVAIYISSDGSAVPSVLPDATNLVMLGNIDRISKSRQRDEDSDKITVRYQISGRDFGKVFEDTDVWFNPYVQPQSLKDLVLTVAGRQFTGSPSTLVESVLTLFFGKGSTDSFGTIKVNEEVDAPIRQSYLPSEIVNLFGSPLNISTSSSEGVPFLSLVRKKIQEDLPGFKPRAMLSPSNSSGSVWSILKRESNDLINALYVELIRDSWGKVEPSLVLRPHPNSVFFKDTPGKLKNSFWRLSDYDEIVLNTSEIKYEDLGKDGNSRINMIWLTARQSKDTRVNDLAYIGATKDGIGLPMFQSESINRYGLKTLEQTLDFCYDSGKSNSSSVSIELYRSFINQIYDMHVYNHLYETGSIVAAGVAKAQIGSCLRVTNSASPDQDRLYYITGYTHTWSFPDQWETEFQLTHGQFASQDKPFIDVDSADGGKPDDEMNKRYLVKTKILR